MRLLLFSIIITCFNQFCFVGDAVESALAQDESLREIIVVDDGSNDGSRELLRRYRDRVRLVPLNRNEGTISARNRGAALARGRYLCFLDGDDAFMPWSLALYAELIERRNPKMLFARRFWFKGPLTDASEVETPHTVKFVEYANLMQKDRSIGYGASAFVVERRTFEEHGGWTQGIFQLDLVDIALKLGYAGRALQILSPASVYYRIHSGNAIHSTAPFLQMALRLIEKERNLEYPGGQRHRFERRAFLGGPLAYWVRLGLARKCRNKALKVCASGSVMIACAVLHRLLIRATGKTPVQVLDLPYRVRPVYRCTRNHSLMRRSS